MHVNSVSALLHIRSLPLLVSRFHTRCTHSFSFAFGVYLRLSSHVDTRRQQCILYCSPGCVSLIRFSLPSFPLVFRSSARSLSASSTFVLFFAVLRLCWAACPASGCRMGRPVERTSSAHCGAIVGWLQQRTSRHAENKRNVCFS